MKIESVEIYSDASNAAIMRHPGRRFPGVLVQGDTLHSIVGSLQVETQNAASLGEEPAAELAGVLERLEGLLAHYRSVLTENHIQLPFGD